MTTVGCLNGLLPRRQFPTWPVPFCPNYLVIFSVWCVRNVSMRQYGTPVWYVPLLLLSLFYNVNSWGRCWLNPQVKLCIPTGVSVTFVTGRVASPKNCNFRVASTLFFHIERGWCMWYLIQINSQIPLRWKLKHHVSVGPVTPWSLLPCPFCGKV